MPITVPDSDWYKKKSLKASAPFQCPYANVHKCHRYYASIYMLGEAGMSTSISDNKIAELDKFWEESDLLPAIAEDDTGVSYSEGTLNSCSNFCPEISFEFFHYYASYLAKYADEIDRETGNRIAEREGISNDWRLQWSSLTECHFLDCSVYNQVSNFNSKKIGKFDQLAHSNVVVLIDRMERCLDKNDPSGVLHAAASILETTAQDILGSDKLSNQSLGSFIDKYENKSALPDDIKNVVRAVYKLRNTMPLSGHGSTNYPNINMHDAILIAATVKFIVEIEYRMKKLNSNPN